MTMNPAIVSSIKVHRQEIAQTTMQLFFESHPEQQNRYDEQMMEKSYRDINYHLDYLIEALTSNESILFTSYVVWCRTLFERIGLQEHILTETLRLMSTAINKHLDNNTSQSVDVFFDNAMNALRMASTETASFPDHALPYSGLCKAYLNALLKGDRPSASQLILKEIESGTSLKDIYIHVFQQSQYEIGRLWQTSQISIAQEHYCTAATQMIMSQLYSYVFNERKAGKVLVSACVAGELHEIGIRMVTDLFELDGWDTYYLGANTPNQDIISFLEQKKADVLAVSTTMTFHISKIRELISQIRQRDSLHNLIILVGGYPFLIAHDLWKQVGADGCASDALGAIELANTLSGRCH